MQRLVTSLLTILAVLVWSNHCIIGDVFASQKTPTHQTSHCHGENSDEKGGDKGNHHSECQDSGCCQPAIQAYHSIDQAQILLDVSPVSYVSIWRAVFSEVHSVLVPHPPTGPPLVTSLPAFISSIAPNAPPVA